MSVASSIIYPILVSSHTPLRGYSTPTLTDMESVMFQVIPPCGGIPSISAASSIKLGGFQVIPPCGGILPILWLISNGYRSFKSYPLAGVFLKKVIKIIPEPPSFKSYPLAGVFVYLRRRLGAVRVSSHTPLRGYSGEQPQALYRNFVSSHTPLRGYSWMNPTNPTMFHQCFKSYPLAGVFLKRET